MFHVMSLWRRGALRPPQRIIVIGCVVLFGLTGPITRDVAFASEPGRRYEFVNIADSSGPLRQYSFGLAAINNSGTVAFSAEFDGGGSGLFTRDTGGGPLKTVVETAASELRDLSIVLVAINEAGTIAFGGPLDNGRLGVFTIDSSGNRRAVAEGFAFVRSFPQRPDLQQYPYFGDRIDIDGAGNAVFRMFHDENHVSIVKGNGGALTTVVDNRGPLRSLGTPSVNHNGAIAFVAQPDDGSPTRLFVAEGGTVRQAAAPETLYINDVSSIVSINNRGTIAVGGATVDDDAVKYFTTAYSFSPSINNDGVTAYNGSFNGSPSGIYAGPDRLSDKVIAHRDTLFGSVVISLAFLDGGLNDRGEIAFQYGLADGRWGIAVARPVPEPGVLMAPTIFALCVMRRCVGRSRRSG